MYYDPMFPKTKPMTREEREEMAHLICCDDASDAAILDALIAALDDAMVAAQLLRTPVCDDEQP